MSFNSEYLKLRSKRIKKEKQEEKSEIPIKLGSSSSSKNFTEEYIDLRGKETLTDSDLLDIAPLRHVTGTSFVGKTPTAPDLLPYKMKKGSNIEIISNGAFADGYQFGDVSAAILGTGLDLGLSAVKGVGRLAEGVGDALNYGIAYGADKLGNEDFAEILRKETQKSLVDKSFGGASDFLNKYSLSGRTMDSVAEGVGQALGIMATGGLGKAVGLGAKGISAITTGTTFTSGLGSGMSEAYQEGATDEQALKYGLISGSAEAVSELLFGGMGKGVNALGFSRGLTSVDDMLAKKVADKFTNQIAKNFTEFGIKASAEGLEEVLSGTAQAIGKWKTYKTEEDIWKILKNENLFEQFVVGMVTSGFMQSGIVPGTKQGSLIESNKNDADFITGLNTSEQAVVDKVYEDAIAEAEKDGKKLSSREKSKLYDEVVEQLEKGEISIEAIESVLGGETYEKYKAEAEKEDAILSEYETLGKKTNATLEEQARYKELGETVKGFTGDTQRSRLRQQLNNEIMGIVKGSRLTSSYTERAKRGQTFEADLSQYDEKQQAIVQKAMESGVLNNTRRTHEFVDLVAKICADKGLDFDFFNNEKIKDTRFAVEGRIVNGYRDGNTIGINIQSQNALRTVVGHEITHVLEGTELYDVLQDVAIEFSKTKGDYGDRMLALRELYTGKYKSDANGDFETKLRRELTADIVGEYLFTDSEFINRLSTEQPSLFKKIFDEIKYLCRVATAGSKEARELEKVKKAFADAWKQNSTAQNEEKSTKYSFGGVKSKTHSFEALEQAIRLDDIGKATSEEIRQQTGWFRGYDGKWRYEINDRDMEIDTRGKFSSNPDVRRYTELVDKVYFDMTATETETEELKSLEKSLEGVSVEPKTLSELIKHDELFAAYPQLKDIPVYFTDIDIRGAYNPVFKEIVLQKSLKLDKVKLSKTLVHEIQHAIQDIEGFASGSNPEYWQDVGIPESEIREYYEKTAGEIEARDSAQRSWRTDEARKEKRPDIDRTDVVFVESGVSGYEIKTDIDGNKFVEVDETLFDTKSGESHAKTIARIIKERFNNLVNVNGQQIQINQITNGEWRLSGSARKLLKNDTVAYDDKLKTIPNADEILKVAKNWVGEEKHHSKNIDIVEFARGNVFYRVGNNGYVADVIVGIRRNNSAVLYDLVEIRGKKITEAPVTMASYENNSQRRQNASVADILPQNPKKSSGNTEFSLSEVDTPTKEQSHKEQQFAIIQENNPMWDEYHTGIRSIEDIHTWEEVLDFNDESIGQFVWGDFSRKDAEKALKENSITIYSSHPIENGTFVSTSYIQAQEYAGGKPNNKVYSKTVPLNEVAWINGDEGQYAPVETDGDVSYSLSLEDIKTKYADKTDYLFLFEHNDTISIDNMVVKKEYRNRGIGTQILNDIITYADRNGKTITLTPTTEFGTQNKLKKWYKANGFVENKGRNADLRLSDTMYRLPNSKYSLSMEGSAPTREFGQTYGEDVMLDTSDDIAPVQEDVAPTEDIGPVRDDLPSKVPQTDVAEEFIGGPVRDDIPVAPQTSSADNPQNNIVPDKEPVTITTVQERLEAKFKNATTELENLQKLRAESISRFDTKIADYQARYEAKKNKDTKVANELLRSIERLKKSRDNITAGYDKRISDVGSQIAKIEEQLQQDHSQQDKLEMSLKRIDARLERKKAALIEEFNSRKKKIEESTGDKDAFVSEKAYELYRELLNLKKGVRASKELSALLDLKPDWSELKHSLLDIKFSPARRVDENSSIESFARELIESVYEDSLYSADELEAELTRDIEALEAEAEKARMRARREDAGSVRKKKQQQYETEVSELIGDTSSWQDKSLGISYQTNTLHRNLRDVVRKDDGSRDIAKADRIYEYLQGSYNRNEAELKRELKRIKRPFIDMKINKHESEYIQMLGELRFYPGTTLTRDAVDAYYEMHKDKIDVAKVEKAITESRKVYDDLIQRVNEVLKAQGMKEIPYIKGYYPHFTKDKQGLLGKLLNWKTLNNDIPTDIAGLTEMFIPVRTYQSFNKHREARETDYDFAQGFDTYVHGALDWIYHIEDIQKRRAFENVIRYRHSEVWIQNKVDEIRGNVELDADEAQELIDLLYNESQNPLGNFILDIRNSTNNLAGKKSTVDRTMEYATNRHVYSTMTNISNRVSANMVAGSISSALTNFIPITQSWGQVNPVYSLAAAKDAVRNAFRNDGMIEKSTFMTNRLLEEENLKKTGWDVVGEKIGLLMNVADRFTTEVVWRSKYLQNLQNGMSESEAINNADIFAENVMAGRSRGNMPTIFNSKNPVVKTLTAFQLEVANQYGYMFKDMPQDIGERNINKLVSGYTRMFVGAFVYNALFSALTGRDSAFDPIGIIVDLCKDLGLGADDDEEEETDIFGTIKNLGENVAQEIPFVGGLLGGGRIPISNALPYELSFEDLLTDIEGWTTSEDPETYRNRFIKEFMKPIYYTVMPMGGGQLKKTTEGLKMFDDDLPIAGSYTDSGDLRFPVDDSFKNKLQAGVFGQYAGENAQLYFDEGYKPLNEKQIQEYIDLELPIADYWKYREGLAEQETVEDKFEYINGLNVSDEQKNIMINNAIDRKETVDMSNYDDFSDYEEFDFYIHNKEKYEFLELQGVSYKEYKANESDKEFYDSAYSWYKNNPDKVAVSKVVTDSVIEYRRFSSALDEIRADKDAQGKPISGSAKAKKKEYIFGLDIDDGAKYILYRSQYPKDDTYNHELLDYILARDDVSYEDKKTILKELEFTIDSNGYISW